MSRSIQPDQPPISLNSSHAKSEMRKRLNWLVGILLFSLVVKLVILLIAADSSDPSRFFSNDTDSYVNSARALLQTGTYSVSPDQLEPQTIRTPGYPIFLALIYGMFGENQTIVMVVQILFGLGTIGIVYWLGGRLWNSKTGVAASLLLILDMNSAGFSLLLLTETLFTFFLSAFIATIIFIMSLETPSAENRKKYLAASFICGVFLSIATHIRPISYYLIFLMLFAWSLWGWLKKWKPGALFANLLSFALPLIILVGGWQARNYFQTGSAQFCAIENLSLINYRAAMVVAERDGISRDEAMQQITEQYGLDKGPGWNDTWRKVGAKIIIENPSIFIKQSIKGLVNVFIGPGSETLADLVGMDIGMTSPLGDFLRLSSQAYAARWIFPHPFYFSAFVFSFLHMLLVYIGAVIWMVQALFMRQMAAVQVFLLGVVAYLVLISAGPEAYYRFRVPITPVLVLLAAGALVQFSPRKTISDENYTFAKE